MKENKNIFELEAIAPVLATLSKGEVYQVPKSFWGENMETILKQTIYAKPLLESLPKRVLYPLETKYLSNFSNNLMAAIHSGEVAEELEINHPILSTMAKVQPYAAPALYFNHLSSRLLAMANSEPSKPSISERVTTIISIWYEQLYEALLRPQYSFALASSVGVLMLLGLVYNNKTLSLEERTLAQLHQLPTYELHHYLSTHHDDFDEHTILHRINEIDLNNTHLNDAMLASPIEPEGELID